MAVKASGQVEPQRGAAGPADPAGDIARLAPGTALRDGLERILRGRTAR
jgi:DNA integrity scanning protein DisA with diadenylate cyclase activity